MGLTYHLQSLRVNCTMLGVYSDWILGWYLNLNGSYGLLNTCYRKGYKTSFCRFGHICQWNHYKTCNLPYSCIIKRLAVSAVSSETIWIHTELKLQMQCMKHILSTIFSLATDTLVADLMREEWLSNQSARIYVIACLAK